MNEERSPHFGAGIVSLFVIFASLCMAVLALLTWQTARNEASLAARAGEAAQAYYAADAQACHIRKALEQEKLNQVKSTPIEWDGNKAYFACAIDDALILKVVLNVQENKSTVLAWCTEPASEWQPDETITVWGGG